MLLNPLQLSACSPGSFTHLLLWSICWGIAGSRWLHVLPSCGCELGWLHSGSPWEREASPLFFFPPFVFFVQFRPNAGSWARKPFILRCEGYAWAPRGTAAPIRGLFAASNWGLGREFRGGNLCSLVFVVSGSFTYFPLLHHVDEACIWAYCHDLISSWVVQYGLGYPQKYLGLVLTDWDALLIRQIKSELLEESGLAICWFYLYHDSTNHSLSSALLCWSWNRLCLKSLNLEVVFLKSILVFNLFSCL